VKQPDSNPLRKELARSQEAGSHLDSDMLTAFAEGSLLARERESVLEHLARCARCREELSIAADASPELGCEVQQPLPRPTRPGLRSWLPWVAAAAGVLIVSSALLLREQWKPVGEARSGEKSVATKEIAQSPAQLSPLPPEPKTASAPQPHKARGPVARSGPIPRQEENSTTASASIATARSAPLQKQIVKPTATQAEVANSSENSRIGSRVSGANRAELSRAVGAQGAVAAGSNAGFADAASVPMMRGTTSVDASRPHWRINDFGQLERSFGDGFWQRVAMRETSKLHVVSVSGSEVWAGGENLRLEHSGDNGDTWESTKLAAKNGYNHAVTHIRFQTPREGTIESDDGTSWKTIDGGRTWK
jgi:Putative zinc-finger